MCASILKLYTLYIQRGIIMVTRHVNTFSKSIQVNNVYVNRWQPQQPAAPKIKSGGTNWAMLGGLFMGLAQGIGGAMQTQQTQTKAPVQQQQAGPTAEEKAAKQKAELQKAADIYGYTIVDNNGEYTALKAGEEPIKGDFASVINGMAAKNVKPSQKQQAQATEVAQIKEQAKAEESDGAGGNAPAKPDYRMEENPGNLETVKTIIYGGPYHYAQYYTDADGKQIRIGSPEFNQIVNMLKTEMGSVKDNSMQRTLPKTLTVNGKEFKLMDAASRDALGLRGKPGGANAQYEIKQNASTYTIYKKENNKETVVNSGLTKAQAEQLMNQYQAE